MSGCKGFDKTETSYYMVYCFFRAEKYMIGIQQDIYIYHAKHKYDWGYFSAQAAPVPNFNESDPCPHQVTAHIWLSNRPTPPFSPKNAYCQKHLSACRCAGRLLMPCYSIINQTRFYLNYLWKCFEVTETTEQEIPSTCRALHDGRQSDVTRLNVAFEVVRILPSKRDFTDYFFLFYVFTIDMIYFNNSRP